MSDVARAEGVSVLIKKVGKVLMRKALSQVGAKTDSLPILKRVLRLKNEKGVDAELFEKLFELLASNSQKLRLYCPIHLYFAFSELRPWFESKHVELICGYESFAGFDKQPVMVLAEKGLFPRELTQAVLSASLWTPVWSNPHYIVLSHGLPVQKTDVAEQDFSRFISGFTENLDLERQGSVVHGPLNTQFQVRAFSTDKTIVNEVYSSYFSHIQKMSFVEEPEYIVDIGGQIGSFSVFCAKLFPKARIYCFEPEPGNFELLEKNVALNAPGQVQAHEMAVSDRAGQLKLFVSPSDSGGHRLEISDPSSVASVDVNVTTLENLTKDFAGKNISILKVDVEGSELKILRAGKDILQNSVDKIFVETGQGVIGGVKEDVIQLLKECGFSLKIEGDPAVCLIVGEKTPSL